MAGYLGQLGFVEMSRFYSNRLGYLWTGYASPESRAYNSALVDFQFDQYD